MFITFEGGEGSGKTTLIRNIKKHIEKTHEVLVTREPGGCEISEAIREIILDKKNINMTYQTEALLYAASRNQHIQDLIKPALTSGKVVLCDRFIDSSLAYQGHARKLGFDYILNINQGVEDCMPTMTFFIDVDAHTGLSRIQGREKIDRLDLEHQTFHESVREGYLILAEKYKDRIIVLDGTKPLKTLEKEMISYIDAYESH